MLAKDIEKNIIKEHIILTILFIFIISDLIYYNPLSESMSCDEYYKCEITETYLGNIKSKNTINLTKNNYVELMRSGFINRQELHLVLKEFGSSDIIPFKHGINGFNERSAGEYQKQLKSFNKTKSELEKYIKNPENGFSINTVPYNNYLKRYGIVFLALYIFLMLREFPISDIKKGFTFLLDAMSKEKEY